MMDGMLPDFSAEGARLSYQESKERTGLSIFAGLRVHDGLLATCSCV